MRIRLAHHKGRETQGNKEIIWNHTGWMLLLLLLMWENDPVYCIIHSSSNSITEVSPRRPDYTESSHRLSGSTSFLVPFVRLSIPHIDPSHPPIPPSFHCFFKHQSLLPLCRSSIPSSPQPSKPPLLSPPKLCWVSPSLAFITPSSLCFHLSVSPQVQDGCGSHWDLLKMSLLTDWMRHFTALLIYPSSAPQ